MAGKLSRAGNTRALNAALGIAAPAAPSGGWGNFQYLALDGTTAPTDNTLGNEYTATGYARQLINWTAPTAADPPLSQNTGVMTFGPFSAGTGLVLTYAEMFQLVSGGVVADRWAWWTLTSTRTPANGDSIQVAAAALTMSNL